MLCLAFFSGGGGGGLQIHFINSCRPHADCSVTADRKDTDFLRLTSFFILILSEQVLGTQIKLIARAPAIQDPSLKGNLVNVCVQIPVDSHAN